MFNVQCSMFIVPLQSYVDEDSGYSPPFHQVRGDENDRGYVHQGARTTVVHGEHPEVVEGTCEETALPAVDASGGGSRCPSEGPVAEAARRAPRIAF